MNNMLAMKGMTTEQLAMVQSGMNNKQKSKGIAYLLWFFLGGIGGHRYYAGDIGMGIAMTLTLGGLGVWALIDAFLIGNRIEQINNELEMSLINQAKSMNN